MKLQDINKKVYRENLNKVIIGFVIVFAILSIGLGQILINIFGVDTSLVVDSGEQPSNFRYNLMGVILALFACAAILHQVRAKPFFKEIYYVWQLKQIQNLIYRKLSKIKTAAKAGEQNALIILQYYYASQKQVYLLDDNTLTMSKLEKDISELNEIIQQYDLSILTEQFNKTLIDDYK